MRDSPPAQAIDIALREHRAQPGGQAAAALIVAKQRLPLASARRHAIQLRIQRIGEFTRALRAIERVGGTIQQRPIFTDEPLPRVLIASSTQTRELEIGRVAAHV